MTLKDEHPKIGEILDLWWNGRSFKMGITQNGKTIYDVARILGEDIESNTISAYMRKVALYQRLGKVGNRLLDGYGLNFGCVAFAKNAPAVYGIANNADEHKALCDKVSKRAYNADKKADGVKTIVSKELALLNGGKKEDRLKLLEALGKRRTKKYKKKSKK